MNLKSIWSALEESYGACSDTSAPAIEKFAEENHLSAGYWSWGPAIILFPDETISPAQWMKIFPYGIPQTINERLAWNVAESGTTIVYTTHYLEEAETLCRRIGILDHGRLLAEGTVES